MRPRSIDEFVGQGHLLAPGKPLRHAIETDHLHSMILWGPPGTGKTTLARLVAAHSNAAFLSLSAVLSGVKEIRAAVEAARQVRHAEGRRAVLFIDEVHRFNKSQQDALLPHVEDGTVDLRAVLAAALADAERGLGGLGLEVPANDLALFAEAADGDARRALNLLEIAAELAEDHRIARSALDEVLGGRVRRFDKGGDVFFDQISALHKSVRGSSPDAALYWLCRMLDGGCDPLYVARRVVRMASEDIGNADPRALEVALAAWDVLERLGSPEGELALAQAVVYMAAAPKSNAVYVAFGAAMADVRAGQSHEVPVHLRNAPTRLMKELGHGREYRYAHDEPGAYAAGETYFPDALGERRYYLPTDRGLEAKIGEKLARLRQLDAEARGTKTK